MRKTLYWKLALAFMFVAVIAIVLIAIFIRITNVDRLTKLITEQQGSSLQASMAEYYAITGSWLGVKEYWQTAQMRPTQSSDLTQEPNTNNPFPPEGRDRRNFFGLVDADRVVLVSVDPKYPEGSTLPEEMLKNGFPITVDGQQVGTIINANTPPGFLPEENLFLTRTNQALLLGVAGALLIALVVGFVLARTLTRPLRDLTQAAQRIADGNLEQQVKVNSKDEIGDLAIAFNQMSHEVAHQSLLRKQMTADIAHDLRTPLTVIAGYIESMQDGVLQPTPERLALIYSEIERLQNLVGDLRMLSQADAGELPLNPQKIEPASLLERSAALFQHQAEKQQITLEVQVPEVLPEIFVDEARMLQVFDNLISNAFRYTPAGGRISLSGKLQNDRVVLSVNDTGSGISIDEQPYIFDRFYRADRSRHAENGESGLGLAIVKALIESQNGKVWAESKPEHGTTIYMEFPVNNS
jgi:signal transduction histidine kinase